MFRALLGTFAVAAQQDKNLCQHKTSISKKFGWGLSQYRHSQESISASTCMIGSLVQSSRA